MMSERRKNFRVEWQSPALIYEGDWSSPCILSDFSNGGAKISGVAASAAPERFMLRIRRGPNGVRRCQVLWRTGDCLGVEFIEALTSDAHPASQRSGKAKARPVHAH